MEYLKAEMERIVSSWNGDERGIKEDRAHVALEVLEHIKAIKELLKELA